MPRSNNDNKKRKEHCDEFWNRLVSRRVKPEQLVPHLPGYTELEIAALLIQARLRVDEAARDRRLHAEADACDLTYHADLPRHMRESRVHSTAYIKS